jgi:hypothetical protein
MEQNEHLDGQLTLDVGGEAPSAATIKISGSLGLARELRMDEPCRIMVIGPDGEQLAQADGAVTGLGFSRKVTKDLSYVVRNHTVKLTD